MNIMYGFLALVFIVFYYRIFFAIEMDASNINEPSSILITPRKLKIKPRNVKIPLTIYQTWKTKNLPPKMSECVKRLQEDNPEFEHHLYDDTNCRQFIADNFEADVLEAYDTLVPGAYKSDLWRYCILYKKGGIYLDIKFQCESGFKLSEMVYDDETFVLDRPFEYPKLSPTNYIKAVNAPNFYDLIYPMTNENQWINRQTGLYNAVMATKPNTQIMWNCIREIVKNVKSNYYGFNPLYPTGPGLLSIVYFGDDYKRKVNQLKYFNSIDGTRIISKDRVILSHYPEYRQEQDMLIQRYTKTSQYYHDLWMDKNIYIQIEEENPPPKQYIPLNQFGKRAFRSER